MNDTVKIPQRTSFKFVELKKKGRQRTAKLELRHEFDEVVTNQRITMCFDFFRINAEIEEAEKDYHAAMHKNKNKLLDTDDESSMSNEVRRKKERLDLLEKRKKELEETHADFSFDGKVIQHKLKFKDESLITEIIYQVDKKTIYWFDDFGSFLDQYFMMIKDHAERAAEQKKFENTMNFGCKVTVNGNALKMLDENNPVFDELVKKIIRKSEDVFLAKQMQEIFDALASLFKGKINDLKVILEGHRHDLERIKQTTNPEKSILSIAIDEAEKQDSGMGKMVILAAGFDFIEILKQYEE